MSKKIYLIVTIAVVAVCGILNVMMFRLLSENEPSAEPSTSVGQESGDVPQTPEATADYAAGDNSYWTPERHSRIVISEYDAIIRQVAADKGHDWRFIAAVAFAESCFDEDLVSSAGAVGLMQIMPVVARQFKVDFKHVGDPHTNISLGVELLDYIGRTLRFPRSTSEKDRLSIILASYNCGMGHVLDARRLAAKYGENPNSWNIVSKYLVLKSDPAYYNDEVVRCGVFIDNRQTLGFVKKVIRYYDSYCEIAMR